VEAGARKAQQHKGFALQALTAALKAVQNKKVARFAQLDMHAVQAAGSLRPVILAAMRTRAPESAPRAQRALIKAD
jgi:hypothetical protein